MSTDWLLLPTVNVEVLTIALMQFAQAVGAGADRHVVLVLDRAGCHSSQMLTVPDGIHLVFLPPYSPELQPAERLWPLTNEHSQTDISKHLMNYKRYKRVAVSCFKMIRRRCVLSHTIIGGQNSLLKRPQQHSSQGLTKII